MRYWSPVFSATFLSHSSPPRNRPGNLYSQASLPATGGLGWACHEGIEGGLQAFAAVSALHGWASIHMVIRVWAFSSSRIAALK